MFIGLCLWRVSDLKVSYGLTNWDTKVSQLLTPSVCQNPGSSNKKISIAISFSLLGRPEECLHHGISLVTGKEQRNRGLEINMSQKDFREQPRKYNHGRKKNIQETQQRLPIYGLDLQAPVSKQVWLPLQIVYVKKAVWGADPREWLTHILPLRIEESFPLFQWTLWLIDFLILPITIPATSFSSHSFTIFVLKK